MEAFSSRRTVYYGFGVSDSIARSRDSRDINIATRCGRAQQSPGSCQQRIGTSAMRVVECKDQRFQRVRTPPHGLHHMWLVGNRVPAEHHTRKAIGPGTSLSSQPNPCTTMALILPEA